MEYSLMIYQSDFIGHRSSLNPYSNGILSDPQPKGRCGGHYCVLILILMEYSLIRYLGGDEYEVYES